MCPAHVSFPIRRNLTDARGDGGLLTPPLIQLSAMGDAAVALYLCSPAVHGADKDEIENVGLLKCG